MEFKKQLTADKLNQRIEEFEKFRLNKIILDANRDRLKNENIIA
jgi:hypothetical protein